MKYEVKFTNQFKKDVKLAKKQNKKLDKLFEVIGILAEGGELDAKYRDHDLSGNYKGTRECHIEPDFLLIYQIIDEEYLNNNDAFRELMKKSKEDFDSG